MPQPEPFMYKYTQHTSQTITDIINNYQSAACQGLATPLWNEGFSPPHNASIS